MKPIDVRYLRRELEEYRRLAELMPEGGWRTAALEKRIQRQADQLAEYLWQITKELAKIEDPELRLICELRHFRGYSWAEVADALPVKISPSAARMKYTRYQQKQASAE